MKRGNRRRNVAIAGAFFAALVVLGGAQLVLDRSLSARAQGTEAPMFEVDPFWPKPLPNNWVIGSTIGVTVDSRDHVFIIHRPATLQPNEIPAGRKPPVATECCIPAPPVL
ncbi:MAG: hypothetical protein HC770_13595, partial [Pseudanabaena sp. CRU_2_10]|nr:hypothetical protein [Pseudanabaena sp. CRU_2_10]